MTTKYIAYPWPEYQEYMGEEWFREECYYCADKDVYFIPVNRVNESENKEIRKDIISNLKKYINCIKDGYDAPSAKDFVVKEIEKQIAWLEKQEEKKPTLPKWKYKNDNTPLLRDSLILNKYGCVAKSPSGAFVNDVWVIDYDELAKLPKEELEKQGEQETFCDKCRKEHPSHSCQDITELGRCSVEHEQKSDNSYCQENCKGFQQTGRCFCDGECKAKKEYIEQNLQENNFPQIEQKPAAWSEEDERRLNFCLNILRPKTLFGSTEITNIDTINTKWLKSLKDRIQPHKQWKPSNEQIKAFEHFVRSIGESGYVSPYENNTKLLYSLLEQLKKL